MTVFKYTLQKIKKFVLEFNEIQKLNKKGIK